LLLQHGSQQACPLVVAGLHRQVKADSIFATRTASLIQQPRRPRRIEIVARDIAAPRPMIDG